MYIVEVPGSRLFRLCSVLPSYSDLGAPADRQSILPGVCGGREDHEGLLQSGVCGCVCSLHFGD